MYSTLWQDLYRVSSPAVALNKAIKSNIMICDLSLIKLNYFNYFNKR